MRGAHQGRPERGTRLRVPAARCGGPLGSGRRPQFALAELDPRQRAAVVMHDLEGKTLQQVSRELGRPLQTVASQVYAGRERLARLLRRRPITASAGHGSGTAGQSGGRS